jgi:hypothetical protein
MEFLFRFGDQTQNYTNDEEKALEDLYNFIGGSLHFL